jgi:hypothetical protein
MDSKNIEMQNIFNELSERNKDVMLLIAKSVNIAQENPKKQNKPILDKTVQQNNKKKNENRVYSTQKSVALYVAANQKVVE